MSTEIRMGIIGCGSIANIAHFPAIQKRKEAKLVAVCDIDATTSRADGSKVGR